MGWLIVLAILVLLAILPLGVSARYDSDGPIVKIIVGPIWFQVFPARKKTDSKKKEKAKLEEKTQNNSKQENTTPVIKDHKESAEEKKGGAILDFLPLVRVALDLLGEFSRKLRVDRLELDLVLAGEDPCDLALNYGKAWTALGNLWPKLEEIFVIKKRKVEVQCDFEASQTCVIARLDITITVGRLLSMAVRYGIRALVQFIQITNKRKGGAQI